MSTLDGLKLLINHMIKGIETTNLNLHLLCLAVFGTQNLAMLIRARIFQDVIGFIKHRSM